MIDKVAYSMLMILALGVSILFIMWFFSPNHEMKNRAKKGSQEFYRSELSGKITDFYSGVGGVNLKLNNHYLEFNFVYQPSSTNPSIGNAVDVGDSLIKQQNSSFFLIKKQSGKIFEYKISPSILKE